MSLFATRVSASDAPSREIVLTHGIYGRGRNLQAVARGLVAARPEYGCWLLDLPYHGDSGPGAHGDSVFGLAADVELWLASANVAPDAVLGHSYGGKVVLALAARGRRGLRQVWIIDSTPEVKPPSGSAWDMLQVIRRGPASFASRDEAVRVIVNAGFDLPVGQWMATNLVRSDDGAFAWRLDFDAMERLLQDFFVTDMWATVESPPAGVELHFLKASVSSAISPAAERRIDAASSGGRVFLHRREGGHWIHAEKPDVVTKLLVEHLP